MFKISLLHGTSAGKQQQHHSSHGGTGPAASDSSNLSALLEPRDWAAQAASCTTDLPDATKFKSLAIYAEVKLAEALDRAAKACPDSLGPDGQLLPNSLKTAVTVQLLGELAELCGPFSSTLKKLQEALIPAIYSSYAAARTGAPLQFNTMPWFAVAEQLRGDNSTLLAQQEAFTQELQRHEAQMAAVEQQLLAFKAAMDAGEAAAAALQATNAELAAARDAAEADAAAAGEKSRKLAAEASRLKEELGEAQEQLCNARDLAAQDQDQWDCQLAALKKQLHVESQKREAAVVLAAARLTPAEGRELEQRCAEAELKLEEAEAKLAAVAAAAAAGSVTQQQLTPRPTDWGPAQELADKCKATQEAVRQLLQQHATSVTLLQRQVSLLQALALPDPAPQQPWALNLRADSSSYFITEGAAAGPANCPPGLFAEPLGLGPAVPRFLRWDEPVQLQEVSLQELQRQVARIWQQHSQFEASCGPCSLQTFLYYHCSAAAQQQQQQQQQQREEQARQQQQAPQDEADAAAGAEQAATAAAAAAAAGYSFYHALCSHRHDSAAVDVMFHVLTGQLSPEMALQQRHLLKQLVTTLCALRDVAAAGSSGVSVAGVASALQLLFPLQQQQHLEQLTSCLSALAAADGEAASSSSSGASAGRSSCRISSASLTGVVAAMERLLDDSSGRSGDLSQAAGAEEEAATAGAAAALVETALRQHLQDVAAHTQQLCARAGEASSAQGAKHSILQQLAAALSHMTEGDGVPSGQQQQQQQQQQRAASGGKAPPLAAASTGCDLSLVASAAAAAAGRAAGGTSSAAEPAAAAGAATTGVWPGDESISTGNSARLRRWLGSAEQCFRPLCSNRDCVPSSMRHQELLTWFGRQCLQQPAVCAVDVAGALQWCKAMMQRPSAS